MMNHPVHVSVLASTRHRELLAAAQEHRLAAQAGPPQDCRVPVARAKCHPDPRRTGPSGLPRSHRRARAARQ